VEKKTKLRFWEIIGREGKKNKNNKLGRLDWDISMGRRTATGIPNDAFMIHIWCGEKTFFFAPPFT
jgi:hypothetical protein